MLKEKEIIESIEEVFEERNDLEGIKKSDYNSTDDEYFLKLGELAIAVANFIKNHPELEEKKNSGYQF